jgi:flagellar FliJ protein
MTTRFPLQTVLDLMQVRADDAARELGLLIAAERDARSRLALLENYREEYATRFRSAAAAGLTPLQWANFQEFSARLETAITQQVDIVNASRDRTTAGQSHWRDQNQQVQSFDTLAQRHHAALRYKEGKQDQKQTDELAARRHVGRDSED